MFDLKEIIVQVATDRQGLKATELIVEVFDAIPNEHKANFRARTIVPVIQELVNEGRLVEVEYILPQMDYRVKSFILPAGTSVRVTEGTPA